MGGARLNGNYAKQRAYLKDVFYHIAVRLPNVLKCALYTSLIGVAIIVILGTLQAGKCWKNQSI